MSLLRNIVAGIGVLILSGSLAATMVAILWELAHAMWRVVPILWEGSPAATIAVVGITLVFISLPLVIVATPFSMGPPKAPPVPLPPKGSRNEWA